MFSWRTSDRFAPCFGSYSFCRCAGAPRSRTPAAGHNAPTTHFRNRRCLARCRRRLGRAFAHKPAEEASSVTLQIGRRGSRHRRPLPDRPPALQAFRSVPSRTPSVSTQRLSWLPFVPPSPRSSIPESTGILPNSTLQAQGATGARRGSSLKPSPAAPRQHDSPLFMRFTACRLRL